MIIMQAGGATDVSYPIKVKLNSGITKMFLLEFEPYNSDNMDDVYLELMANNYEGCEFQEELKAVKLRPKKIVWNYPDKRPITQVFDSSKNKMITK